MNKAPGKNRFWYLFGPFLIYWGIEFVGAMIASLVMVIVSVPEVIQSVAWKDSMTNEEFMEAAAQMQTMLLDMAARYQVQMLAAAALLTIPALALLYRRDRLQEQMQGLPVNKKAPAYQYIWTAILGAMVCIGGNVLIVMTNLAFVSESYQNTSAVFYAPAFAVQVVCLGLVIPVSEELLFRGLLFRRCRALMGFFPAALSISILFGFSHGNLVQFLYAMGLGMLLAYVCEKYGSLKAAILLHVTANLTSLIMTETGFLDWICGAFIRLAVTVVACAFFGAAMFVLIQRIDEKPEGTDRTDDSGNIPLTKDMFR
ncbi:CPBP family intramembrane glutamic endopeptidase [Schaedlerella arabinosiphila]|uniref:CPBP family intramembrane glutamic endopeptidase n=1 Tax=Schaedlerella arabinosiphila TaxID=2044587 RepID=UPI002557F4F3|nr:type II CAAX endopeptidase family protein [Schaedlerella arabinosiphila]